MPGIRANITEKENMLLRRALDPASSPAEAAKAMEAFANSLRKRGLSAYDFVPPDGPRGRPNPEPPKPEPPPPPKPEPPPKYEPKPPPPREETPPWWTRAKEEPPPPPPPPRDDSWAEYWKRNNERTRERDRAAGAQILKGWVVLIGILLALVIVTAFVNEANRTSSPQVNEALASLSPSADQYKPSATPTQTIDLPWWEKKLYIGKIYTVSWVIGDGNPLRGECLNQGHRG